MAIGTYAGGDFLLDRVVARALRRLEFEWARNGASCLDITIRTRWLMREMPHPPEIEPDEEDVYRSLQRLCLARRVVKFAANKREHWTIIKYKSAACPCRG